MYLNIPTTDSLPNDLLDNPLPIDRVLYEAGEPIVYLTHTKHGQTLLAYFSDESKEGVVTFLTSISKARCNLLEAGCLSVREALTASSLWFHLSRPNGEPQFWVIDPSDIPNEFLPLEGTPLLPEHESVFRTRAIGEHIALGKMPASVVGFVADATRSALKTLLDFTYDIPAEGRPRKNYSRLYDLPIQRFTFASFELGFAAPDEELFPNDEMQQAVQKLEAGLVWAACPINNDTLIAESDAERVAVLRASLMLTPPISGAISEIEISGTWIKHGRIKLTRQSRRKVNGELHKLNKEKVVTCCGRIGEIDGDKLSFILREVTVNGNQECECKGFFEESLLDDMNLFYFEGTRVAVVGVERRERLSVIAVAPENTIEEPVGCGELTNPTKTIC